MSTKKEKCNGTKAEWLLEFENMVKDNSFVTPSSHLNVLAIQDFISKAITTAVAKRDAYFMEEVKKLKIGDCSCKSAKDSCQICGGVYCKIFKNETIENVLSLLKH